MQIQSCQIKANFKHQATAEHQTGEGEVEKGVKGSLDDTWHLSLFNIICGVWQWSLHDFKGVAWKYWRCEFKSIDSAPLVDVAEWNLFRILSDWMFICIKSMLEHCWCNHFKTLSPSFIFIIFHLHHFFISIHIHNCDQSSLLSHSRSLGRSRSRRWCLSWTFLPCNAECKSQWSFNI